MSTEVKSGGYQFGTFAGVFTPSILTIFGVVMFLILGGVVGAKGISGALGLLFFAESIALSTGLSVSLISTNTPVKGGGPYFLISRALGPSLGGAVGFSFYLSQAVSVPFYLLGFVKSVTTTFPHLEQYSLWLGMVPLVLMFVTTVIGADWAMRAQYLIMAVLGISILVFLGGAVFNGPITTENFMANWNEAPKHSGHWFYYLSIFFPAVSGFLSGVSMSGDLKDPAKSLPRGTIAAILTGFVVYFLEIIFVGAAFERGALIQDSYSTLANNALFGAKWLVFAGVIAATLSSAMGSLMGGPRILQAIGQDGIIPILKPFASGNGKKNEPYLALLFSFSIAALIIWWGCSQPSDGLDSPTNPLNLAAALVSMFLLFTYVMINFSAFVESISGNPSFRPYFKKYHWSIGLYGTIAATVCAFCIYPVMAMVAAAIMLGLYYLARRNEMRATFGDARRGFIFSQLRKYLQTLRNMPDSRKNWRPRITVMVSDLSRQLPILQIVELLDNGRGISTIVKIFPGVRAKAAERRREEQAKLQAELRLQQLNSFFPTVVTTPEPEFDSALQVCLQAHSIGPLAPNIIMLGWPRVERKEQFLEHVMTVIQQNLNCLIMLNVPQAGQLLQQLETQTGTGKTIDIWWRGRQNGSLMLILAYLLTCNSGWRNTPIRLLRMVSDSERAKSYNEMVNMGHAARIPVDCRLVPDVRDFTLAFREISADAAVIFMGFNLDSRADFTPFYERTSRLLEGMPPTLLVHSNNEADVLE